MILEVGRLQAAIKRLRDEQFIIPSFEERYQDLEYVLLIADKFLAGEIMEVNKKSEVSIGGKIEDEDKDERIRCFYCNEPLLNNNRENDHFPIPQDCGGHNTVPVCISCHNKKDRMRLEDWDFEWWVEVICSSQHFSTHTKIFMARLFALFMRKKIDDVLRDFYDKPEEG